MAGAAGVDGPEILKLVDLEKEFHRLQFLVDTGSERIMGNPPFVGYSRYRVGRKNRTSFQSMWMKKVSPTKQQEKSTMFPAGISKRRS